MSGRLRSSGATLGELHKLLLAFATLASFTRQYRSEQVSLNYIGDCVECTSALLGRDECRSAVTTSSTELHLALTHGIDKQFTLFSDCITATASLCCSYSTALQCSERCVTRGERLLTSRNGHPVSNRTPPCHSNVISVEVDKCYGSDDG